MQVLAQCRARHNALRVKIEAAFGSTLSLGQFFSSQWRSMLRIKF